MEDEPAASTTQDDEFFEIECGQSRHENENSPPAATSNNPSGRSHSLGSILDYKRTTQWLRDVLNHREAYTTKLTERPEKKKQEGQASLDGRRNSDPPQSDILSARRLSGTSVQTSRRKAKFDGYGFKTAVSDLERLLSEALSIASQVVDRPGTPPRKGYKPPSVSLHSHCRSISSANCNSDSSRLNLTSSLSQDVADDGEEVELDEVARSKRPTCRHAATYSGLPRRPRLNEIIQSYSSEGVEVGTREFPGEAEHANPAPHTGPQVSFEIPGRESTDMAAYPLATTSRVEAAAGSGSSEGLQSHPGHADAPRRHAKEIVVQLKPEQASGAARWHVGKRAARKPHESHGAARRGNEALPERDIAGRPMHGEHGISLRRRSHVSLRGAAGFNLAKSRKRQPTARDWSPIRKRFVAAVACISTALVGVILGIYAGLVPSIQYYIIDQSYATVHGNTGCFLGLAVPTFFLWPLPLLHGRKPYILSSLVLAMPLLFPQALAVNSQRLTHTGSWRSMLLVSRTLMGGCLGFASMNFHSMLTDLFGASLMSVNPHQEVVDQYDARRHGGGMGAWLGIWTWCWIGSLGLGFLIGACIIDGHQPTWGFYVSIVIIAAVLFLNVVCPEVRRSAFRRSIAEVRTGSDISRRIARGEIMMHRVKTGPKWWGQEAYHGVALSLEMLRQPGFAVLALYSAWIYAQVVLVIVLLGSLASRLYKLRSPAVGLLVGSMALGACLAIPFEKANVFSRSRQAQMNSNLATLNRKVAWSSHLVRRTVFTLLLPLAGICYAAVSSGPPLHVSVPTVFAAAIGFLSCLAIAECNGLVMETFDCSDLSPGMVGRQRSRSGKSQKLTNYSSFPRVTAGFAAIHGLAFVLAAGATALGGLVTRTLGQQVSTGVVASILFILTVTLLVVLIRFSDVQIIPKCKSEVMDKLVEARRRSSTRRASTPDDPQAIMEEERAWRPVMIGNPTGKKRRMNVLELGSLTRWQEIRKKNKLIDEGAHLNRAALDQGLEALDDQVSDLQREAREFFTRSGTRHKGSRHQRCTEDESGTADESVEMEEMEAAGEERVPHERWRFRERECVMSQTVGEESEGEGREARRGR
ncbi:hypothetical protein CDD83_10569 [Cordyceps sp. RAO-2017]|nr:hypothetical protein CDD83_10569 [Cordyceps sp. RAO-2017]